MLNGKTEIKNSVKGRTLNLFKYADNSTDTRKNQEKDIPKHKEKLNKKQRQSLKNPIPLSLGSLMCNGNFL